MLPRGRPEDPPHIRRLYRTAFLINAVVLSGLLSHDAALREVLVRSVHMVLPPRMAGPLATLLADASAFPLPDKSTVSRWRLLVDVAYMLYMRVSGAECERWYRYIVIDSSTQGGRDYELMICSSIRHDRISILRRAAHTLANLRWDGIGPC